MNFRFFGDSWFWTWNYDNPIDYPAIQSQEMLDNFFDGSEQTKVSHIEMYLKHMGHTVEHFNNPADPFTTTVDKITGTAPSIDSINVVFYSQDYRRTELRDFFHKNKKDEMRVLKNKLDFVTEKNLTRLAKFAQKTNQKFYLAGGQGTLREEVFNRIPTEFKNNMVLITPCILGCFNVHRDHEPYDMFKLTDITGDNWTNDGGGVDWEKMQPDVIHEIYKEMGEFNKQDNQYLKLPDPSHMNATTVIFFLDLLFQRIEHQKAKSVV